MIHRIDLNHPLGSKALVSSVPSGTQGKPHFTSILEEKLDPSKPLELLTIEFLSRTLDLFLSNTWSDKDNDDPLLVPFPIPAGLPSPSSQPNQPIPPLTGLPLSEASNNLQEETNYDAIVEEASRQFSVDPDLIRAVIEVESNGNQNAVSPAGARGLMQLMPKTAAELGVTNPFDPVENITAGTRYLRQLLDRYWGNVKLALAAYNWGMGNLEKRPEAMPQETKAYVTKVEKLYRSQTTSL